MIDREALQEERDFLLRSLDDLDRELAAGDVDPADHRTLRADYTARAAAVLRALESDEPPAPDPPERRSPVGRRLAVVAGVALVAVLAGVLVAQASGRRGTGGLTGLDVTAASARVDDCFALEGEDQDAALACYSDVLDQLPANVPALSLRGWLQVRDFDVDAGVADLDAAIQLAPDFPDPYFYRAVGRSRSGDAVGAVADLAGFFAGDPPADALDLARTFAEVIVEQAIQECIEGDVTGALPPLDVLRCYRDILEVEPDHARANVYSGWLLARAGADDERALEQLDRGLAADPDLGAGWVFRAALRAHLGDVEGARADLDVFDGLDARPDEVAGADLVRTAIDAGLDPIDELTGR